VAKVDKKDLVPFRRLESRWGIPGYKK